MEEKRCSKCGEVKGSREFASNVSYKDGKSYICFECSRKRNQEWYQRNAKQVKQKANEYYERNREKHCERMRRYAAQNRDKVKEKERYEMFKSEIKSRCLIRDRINRNQLKSPYIKRTIRQQFGIQHPSDQIIELKREQLLLFRNLKKLKEVYNEPNHPNIERIESKDGKNLQGEIHP